MLDFHTHILHNIDDGAPDIEVSVKMLEQAYESGTETVVLSPHFYPKEEETINTFLERRNRRYKELKKACEGKDVPELRVGCEAALLVPFSEFERVHELCIEGTDYLLVEMPYTPWEEWMFESVYNLTVKGIKPIIAHIDRYLHYPKHALAALDEVRPIYQVNSSAFLTRKGRKQILELFQKGRIHVLGSDMHNLARRRNTLPESYIYLQEKFGEAYIRYIEQNSTDIIQNRAINKSYFLPKPQKRGLFF